MGVDRSGSRPSDRLRIVVTGLIAQYPIGGVAWDYLQYAAGLADLGHDVFYVEDTGQWPYDPEARGLVTTGTRNAGHLGRLMERYGLGERWAYRSAAEPRWFGLDDHTRRSLERSTDLVINVSGVLNDPSAFGRDALHVYIDSDPVFTQAKMARGQTDFVAHVHAHDRHFSFGETLATSAAPATDIDWLPTRQPIVLDAWATDRPPGTGYTTVMNWASYNKVKHDGIEYGQKNEELRRFVDLPGSVPDLSLEIALSDGRFGSAPRELLEYRGWTLADPSVVCPDPDAYREYIWNSRGEWSVAKHGYVLGRSGWFSCRTACYLAAGRPAVVQDTGFSEVIPTGDGLFAFDDEDAAVAGLESIERDLDHHAAAARSVAEEYFAAASVLSSLIERADRVTPS